MLVVYILCCSLQPNTPAQPSPAPPKSARRRSRKSPLWTARFPKAPATAKDNSLEYTPARRQQKRTVYFTQLNCIQILPVVWSEGRSQTFPKKICRPEKSSSDARENHTHSLAVHPSVSHFQRRKQASSSGSREKKKKRSDLVKAIPPHSFIPHVLPREIKSTSPDKISQSSWISPSSEFWKHSRSNRKYPMLTVSRVKK